LDEACALAARIADRSPLALRLLKRTLSEGREMTPSAALAHEQAMIGLTFDSDDAHEGCTAFLERRPPVFKGV
jgi:enoyl-CoA hydratase